MVSLIGGCCRVNSKSILSHLLVVVVRARVRHCLVGYDLIGNQEAISVVDENFPVVDFSAAFCCSVEDCEGYLAVVKSLL